MKIAFYFVDEAYVPVSSYSRKQQDNFLIKIKEHGKETIVGSLRFNYMIPVPDRCLRIFEFEKMVEHDRRVFIEKEYRFCKRNLSVIQKRAKKTYQRVISKVNEELIKNSCDFPLLEDAYMEYLLTKEENYM